MENSIEKQIKKHERLIEYLKPYGFGYDGSTLHMCYICGFKDYERGGAGPIRSFYTVHNSVEYRNEEYCIECIEHFPEKFDNFDEDDTNVVVRVSVQQK